MSALAEPGRQNLAGIDFSTVHATREEESLGALKARVDIADLVGRYITLKRRGAEYWAPCPFHADKTPSFKADQRRQKYRCFGCGVGGDALDFLAAIENLDAGGAVRRLRELVDGLSFRPTAPRPAPAPDEPDPEAERRRELAQKIWRQTEVIADGLPFDYLFKRRGLSRWDCDRVRWHPSCPWGRRTTGCIVAPINDHVTGLVVGVWRIRPVLEGEVKRLGLGPARGNAVRLYHAPGPTLVIAEGVEDALAAHELTGLPAWAAMSSSFMKVMVLPASLREVLILADADDVGRASAHALAERLRAEGRAVKVRRPIEGKDANDVLRAGRAG